MLRIPTCVFTTISIAMCQKKGQVFVIKYDRSDLKCLILMLIALLPKDCCFAAYREHFVQNERICPDPLHMHTQFPKNTLLVNLPKTLSLFGPVNDFPCNFATTHGGDGIKKVIVRAIHPSRTLWDYSGADKCDYFIKFKRSHGMNGSPIANQKKDVICRVWKQHDNAPHQGSFYHPMMWNAPNNKITLSFSTYDWEHTMDSNETAALGKPVYLQMVFLVFGDDTNYCSLRVQQYLIDPLSVTSQCNMSPEFGFQHCGQYDCSEAKTVLESIGFRTYEIDELWHSRKSTETSRSMSTFDGQNEDLRGSSSSGPSSSSSNPPGLLPKENYGGGYSPKEYENYFHTTTTSKGVVYNYNNTNSVGNSFHSLIVTSIIVVPLVVLIVAVLAIRCYISRSRGRIRLYDSSENLIVPLNRQLGIMNTHVCEDGNVVLAESLTVPRYWTRDYSMDYIQPIDPRTMHMVLRGSKSTISAPPSYETLIGPPRYSDAIVI